MLRKFTLKINYLKYLTMPVDGHVHMLVIQNSYCQFIGGGGVFNTHNTFSWVFNCHQLKGAFSTSKSLFVCPCKYRLMEG